MVELFGTGTQIDQYVRWYVDPEATYSKDIKLYMDVYKPVNTVYDEDPAADAMLSYKNETEYNTNSRYLYYQDGLNKEKTDFVTGYLHHTESKNPQLRYVYLKAPELFTQQEYIIYCDLSKTLKRNDHLKEELEGKTYKAQRINLRRKYIIRSAAKMADAIDKYNKNSNVDLGGEASFFGNYEIHAPIEANYITLRLPHVLSNYYTRNGTNLVKPDYLHWSFYKGDQKGGFNQAEPVYQVRTKYNNKYGNDAFLNQWDGLIELGGSNVHLRAHVLDVAMEMLQIKKDEKQSRQTYTVVAALGDENGPADDKKIVTITLNLEPNYKALTESELAGQSYQFRTEEIFKRYYKSLGGISFNDDEHGEGHNQNKIVDQNSNSTISDTKLKSWKDNMGIVPLPQSYSDYGFDFGTRSAPGRGEYAFMRSIGVNDISGNVENNKYPWYHFTPADHDDWGYSPFKVYDRLYQLSPEEDKKHGFFMYVDADESPDLITLLPIDNADIQLCQETQIVVTAWVCNLNRYSGLLVGESKESGNRPKRLIEVSEIRESSNSIDYTNIWYPKVAGTDLGFTFKAFSNKTNKEEIIYKYYSGEIENNVRLIDPSQPGNEKYATNNTQEEAEWQQIYMSFTIPANAEYTDYKLEVASNCLHTDGGDFAIDDIRVYMSQPEVHAIQENPCDKTSHLLIKANYDLLLANVGLNEARMTEGNAIKTWTKESMDLTVEGKDHGAYPRHYHMYYTIAEEYEYQNETLEEGYGGLSKDKKGWVVKDDKNPNKYWRYLFLNYNNEKTDTRTSRNGGDSDPKPGDAYGSVVISSYYADMPTKEEIEKGLENVALGVNPDQLAWIETENDQKYVVFDELTIDYGILETGKEYFIQLFPHETGGERPVPSDPCAISNVFTIEKSHTIYFGGTTELDGTTIIPSDAVLTCDLKLLDLSETSDSESGVEAPQLWITAKNMYFDWYLGSMHDFINNEQLPIPDPPSVGEALKQFRIAYPDKTDGEGINAKESDFTAEMAAFINQAIKDSKLLLNRNKLDLTDIDAGLDYSTITLSPVGLELAKVNGVQFLVNGEVWSGFSPDKAYIYCDGPYEFSIRTGELFPASANQAIRIGSWQLKELQNKKGDKYLRIPVFNAVAGLAKGSDPVVLKKKDAVAVTDATVANLISLTTDAAQATEVTDPNISPLDPKTNYLDLQFYGDGVEQDFIFEEGHTYTVEFNYQKSGKTPKASKTAELHIKVVPEYLTWNGKNSNNWNNDDNWERSNRTGDLYFSSGENSDLEAAFVPMKGSYVTIKGNTTTYPQLFPLGEKNGSGLSVENVITTASSDKGAPTENIQYEVVAEDPYDVDKSTSKDPWGNDANRYYAIYYYGNWCNEIYFKPEAMLQYQQHLTYEKAWVDFELTPERWYLLSSPLQDVVSGDMYLPATKGESFGRQTTKAFEDITYNYDGDNNRFNPAVYQRTWNGEALNYLDKTNSDLAIQGDWSNLHNDVYKSYIPGTGFSVGVQLRSGDIQEPNTKTLFRLPKADKTYKLQSSEDGTYTDVPLPTKNQAESLQRSNKLVNIDERSGTVTVEISERTNSKATNEDYHLIGNPFMAALDMSKFLKENTDKIENEIRLFTEEGETVYTITQEGTTLSNTPEQISTIAPLQGFMVKKMVTAGATATITFNTGMTTVENGSATLRSLLADAEPKAAFPQLFITAERDGQQSSAMVACREEASVGYRDREDIVMITDPDRMEVPTVYTLAGNRAVIIHSTPDMHNIPLGIYSDSKDPVVVRFSGVEAFSVPVYLYDAETQTSTLIASSNQELPLSGNTHGRYFLRSDYVPTDNDVVKAKGAISIYSMMPGQVIVSSIDPLTRIWVYNLSGQLVTSRNNLNTPTAYIDGLLPGQIYIVKAETASQVQTEKVEVR
ncbi:T9SS type A sorting domain-containing protein [uncultured Parabacteroides sp.]|uniref:T9SS type A sorting domain-containing protein n=1 Tax=uncultured Parabacteroides sp. TaxID=512312 RepID=UPI00259B9A5E|nr:T9SS type A sorting domain-containing protein [uncultured Parabacteroides sp.]